MCQLLAVSRSGYYQHLHSASSPRKERHDALEKEILHFHTRSMGIYGYRKVAEDSEIFYNRQRRPAALGYVSPVAFEQRGERTKAA